MLDEQDVTAAEIYDSRFVSALFGQWGTRMVAHAGLFPGETVLDVACGTGALTVPAAAAVGSAGRVVGLDANPEMLAVARRKSDAIDWVDGSAETLPFEGEEFDAVLSQFGFMFFQDRPAALREMMRVTRPGGRIAVAVCGALARSPGYHALARLLDRLFGQDVGDSFRAPFVLGNPEDMRRIGAEVLPDFRIDQVSGRARFASVDDLVSAERACVWTLGGLLDDDQFALLRTEAGTVLAPYTTADGRVDFEMPATILTAQKPV